jgi:hypothetical protein
LPYLAVLRGVRLFTFFRPIMFQLKLNYSHRIEKMELKLRLFTTNGLSMVHALVTDPEVIKYTGTPSKDLAETRTRLEKATAACKKYDYGRFAVALKETGKVIGMRGIIYTGDRTARSWFSLYKRILARWDRRRSCKRLSSVRPKGY